MSELQNWLRHREVLSVIAIGLMAFVSAVAIGLFLYGFIKEVQAGGIGLDVGVRDASATSNMGAGGLVMSLTLPAVIVLWGLSLRRESQYRRRIQEMEQAA
jgi:hypothetical protein